MWLLLQREAPPDVVIATGRNVSLQYFAKSAFAYFDLVWEQHFLQDKAILRPLDISYSAANILLARDELGWTAGHLVDDFVHKMCRFESERARAY